MQPYCSRARSRWTLVLVCVISASANPEAALTVRATSADGGANIESTLTDSTDSPPFAWAAQGGGSESDEARGVTMDSSGATLVAGTFQGDIKLFSTKMPLQSQGMHDLFVAKLSSPTTIQWVRQFGGNGDDYAFDIVADDHGNSYVTGCFVGTVEFGKTSLTSTESSPVDFPNCGGGDVFTIKVDPAGNVIWATQAGGPSPEGGNEVALDGQGNILVVANTFGEFSAGSMDFPARGNQDSYMLKYDHDGNLLWAIPFAGPGADQIRGVASDADGNMLVAGRFTDMLQIGAIRLTAAGGTGGQDSYVAKLDEAGTPIWAKRFGGADDDYARGIGTDEAGNIYVSGVYSGRVQFDGLTLSSEAGSRDIFLVKLDPRGAVQWVRSLGGRSKEEGCELEVTDDGLVTLSGEFSDQAMIAGSRFASAGAYDVFVARYDAAGDPLWAIQAGGTGQDVNYAIAIDPTGEMVTTVGTFQQSSQFGSTKLTSAGNTDLFVAQQQAA